MKKTKKIVGLLLTFVLITGVLGGCSGKENGEAIESETTAEQEGTENQLAESTGEKTVVMGVISPWLSLCHVMWPSKDVQQVFATPVFDTMTALNEKGEVEPRILCSWEANEDQTVITAKIEPKAYWHDGEKVTAQDVVFSAQVQCNPAFAGEKGGMYEYIEGVDDSYNWVNIEDFGVHALDDETVEFVMKYPTSTDDFLSTMYRNGYVIPEHLLGDVPIESLETDAFWENPIGSGPFKFDSYIDGERMEYIKNDDYYLGAANFDRLIIKVVDSSAMLSALKSGDVDVTAYSSLLGANDLDMAAEDDNLNVVVADGFSHDHLLINNQKFTKEQRNALNYLINKEVIAQVAFGPYAAPAVTMFNTNHPYYSEDIAAMEYEFNPEKGVALLEEAGFDFSKTYTIHVQSDQEQRVSAATALQQMFSESGVKCEVVQADMATISAGLNGGECDFAVMGSAASPNNPVGEQFYYWVGGWNQMTDSTMSDMCDKIKKALTYEEKYELCKEYQKIQMEETPMIYLYFRSQTFVVSKRLSNVNAPGFAVKNWKYWTWEVNE